MHRAVVSYEGHVNSFSMIRGCVDPHHRYVYMGGTDGHVRIWDLWTGQRKAEIALARTHAKPASAPLSSYSPALHQPSLSPQLLHALEDARSSADSLSNSSPSSRAFRSLGLSPLSELSVTSSSPPSSNVTCFNACYLDEFDCVLVGTLTGITCISANTAWQLVDSQLQVEH